MTKHFIFIFLAISIVGHSFASAEPSQKVEASIKVAISAKADIPEKVDKQIAPKPIEKTQFQLIQITKRILLINKELTKLGKLAPSKEVMDRIGVLQAEMDNLNKNYESLATQIPKEDVSRKLNTKKGWMDEIQEITRPILNSLAEFTERPRKIDNLKAQILRLQDKVKIYEKAQKHILELEALNLEVSQAIKKGTKTLINPIEIQNKFKRDLAELKDNYNPEIILLELEEAERALQGYNANDQDLIAVITDSLTKFMAVRGRNLTIAIGLLCGLWWFLNYLYKVVETKTRLLNKISRSTRKFIKAIYSLVIFLIAFTSSLASLYLLDDWLLLSLLFLILAALIWTSRQFVPKFLKELNLILNMGTVREGERIFYEGIPWLIKEIGFYGILHNPRLQGGVIRIPVGKLIGLSSRQFVKEEDWFPTKPGDWIILGEETFCQVLSQTPEQVVVKFKDSKQTYLTPDFLQLKPINLSSGFLVVVKFGLDYGIQNRICDELPELFQSRLEQIFAENLNSQPPYFNLIKTKFSNAGASSLDLIVIAGVHGSHAENYFSIKRDITKALVMICNENDLVIPFTQMTVTMAKD